MKNTDTDSNFALFICVHLVNLRVNFFNLYG